MFDLLYLQFMVSVVGGDRVPDAPLDFERDANFSRSVIARACLPDAQFEREE